MTQSSKGETKFQRPVDLRHLSQPPLPASPSRTCWACGTRPPGPRLGSWTESGRGCCTAWAWGGSSSAYCRAVTAASRAQERPPNPAAGLHLAAPSRAPSMQYSLSPDGPRAALSPRQMHRPTCRYLNRLAPKTKSSTLPNTMVSTACARAAQAQRQALQPSQLGGRAGAL